MNNGTVRSQKLPTVALLISRQLQQRVLAPEIFERLTRIAHVVGPTAGELEAEALPGLLEGAVACITGWDTPPLRAELLDRFQSLRLIAHSAGSVRSLLPHYSLRPGLCVTHAALALAEGVAEFTVLQALLCLTRLCDFDRQLKGGKSWEEVLAGSPTRLLRAQVVGIVGAGRTGREVIARLRPFKCRMLVYDPYLGADEAVQLGVEQTDLDTLFAAADIVTLHAPLLAETWGMITAAHLALLHDGAILLNTARAGLVDEAALLRELATGRITAALDVFHEEPLPVESPLRRLPNVVLSPHIAALTAETLLRQGQMMVEEVERFLHGEPLHYEITNEMLPILA